MVLVLCSCSYIYLFFFFFKQKTAYEMRISDWSSEVCSSDLPGPLAVADRHDLQFLVPGRAAPGDEVADPGPHERPGKGRDVADKPGGRIGLVLADDRDGPPGAALVLHLHSRAEGDLVRRLGGRIHGNRALHPCLEIAEDRKSTRVN